MSIRALVINLDTACKRMSFQKEQLSRMGIGFERVPAITNDDMLAENYDSYWDGWQRPLASTERACLSSHIECWKIVRDHGVPFMILEDDALLADETREVLATVTQIKKLDLLQLETRNRAKVLGTKIANLGSLEVRKLLLDRAGAAGYVLWPTGAKKLLAHVDKTPGLADSIIGKPGLLRAAQVIPAQVIQNDMALLYGVHQGLTVETSSVSSASHRKVQKSPRQVFRRLQAQLCSAVIQLTRGKKIMVPFGRRHNI